MSALSSSPPVPGSSHIPAHNDEFVPGHSVFPGTELVNQRAVFSSAGYTAPKRKAGPLAIIAFWFLFLAPIFAPLLGVLAGTPWIIPAWPFLAFVLAYIARMQATKPGAGGLALAHFTAVTGLTAASLTLLIVFTAKYTMTAQF